MILLQTSIRSPRTERLHAFVREDALGRWVARCGQRFTMATFQHGAEPSCARCLRRVAGEGA